MNRRNSEEAPSANLPPRIWADNQPIVLVPLSGAPESKASLSLAKTIARIVGAKVHILHVADVALAPKELLGRLGVHPEEVRGMLLEQASGRPAETIARVAAEKKARLVAMATFGKRKPLSPTAEGVLKHAPCPVAFVRPESPRLGERLERILLPLDGTPTTADAIEPAIDLASRSKAELDVLYVVAPTAERPEEPGTFTLPRYMDQPQYEWPAWAEEFLERFCRCVGQCPPPLPTRLFLRRGDPAEEILRFAAENESDLIVLVWRGQFRGKRALTIKAVLRAAPCPVLVLHTRSSGP